MLSLYNLSIRLYFFLIYIVSFFNQNARLWLNGRTIQQVTKNDTCIWFHFASLGEFEQGRPVLEQLRNLHPNKKIVVTFFSPSGY
jgi:3-deoxy-D-manno-octulosonic-acid transferase